LSLENVELDKTAYSALAIKLRGRY